MSTIPASQIVNITPNVLSAGGRALALSGLALSNGTRVPIGSVLSFPTSLSVQSYFGAGSAEANAAAVYFQGFDNSNVKPGAMLVAQYNQAAVGAYLRGGNISGLTVAQLQAITGTISILFDGATYTNATLNLSAATSFSSGATIIATALNAVLPTEGVMTASIATTVLTVTAVTSGSFIPGQVLSGASVTANTKIVNQLTGTPGGIGTYTVDTSQTTSSTAITAKSAVGVTFDSVSGGYLLAIGTSGPLSTSAYATGTTAASLLLTSATGAVLSQGAAAATPSTAMNSYINVTQNWATFWTIFNPDNSGNANKLLFAQWTALQNNRYMYAAWDTDITPTQSTNASASLGQLLISGNYSGTAPIYEPSDLQLASYLAGSVASIDFTQTNGRATMALKGQSGITPGTTDPTSSANLIANGYNFYGAYSNATNLWNFFYPGSVSGNFKWIDTYVNQIQLNSSLQTALMTLLTQVKSIPYNQQGYDLIAAACLDPINAGLNFGSIRAGVTLSSAQIAEVNFAAGKNIAGTLQTQGWYLQIQNASAVVRGQRGSPPCTLWYVDGGSVQQINLTSIVVL